MAKSAASLCIDVLLPHSSIHRVPVSPQPESIAKTSSLRLITAWGAEGRLVPSGSPVTRRPRAPSSASLLSVSLEKTAYFLSTASTGSARPAPTRKRMSSPHCAALKSAITRPLRLQSAPNTLCVGVIFVVSQVTWPCKKVRASGPDTRMNSNWISCVEPVIGDRLLWL